MFHFKSGLGTALVALLTCVVMGAAASSALAGPYLH